MNRVLVTAATAACLACASSGTTPHRFDTLFERGRWTEAAVAFAEAEPPITDRTMYRIGLVHATPDADTFDPTLATGYLGRLVSEFPESPYAAPAGVILGLVSRLEITREEVALSREEAALSRERVAELRRQLEELKAVDLKKPPF